MTSAASLLLPFPSYFSIGTRKCHNDVAFPSPVRKRHLQIRASVSATGPTGLKLSEPHDIVPMLPEIESASPTSIISDRDPIFTNRFWKELMNKLGIQLNLSTAYHPQTDGQTEKVNQCLEQYLRAMVFDKHNKWASYLSLAEWWYNTTWHSAIKTTPFEALYGYSPPLLALASAPRSQVESVNEFLRDRQLSLVQLKLNLKKAQDHMKKNEDKHRTERHFSVGDWVYLKIQPYRQLTLGGSRHQKLSSKFYGPFEIIQCVGPVAYRLSLPSDTLLHPVFHVSQLKGKIGTHQVLSHTLPTRDPVPQLELRPYLILGRRMVPRNNVAQVQLLVQWQNQSPDDATWEKYDQFAAKFPDFIREDTNFVKEGVMRREIGEMRVTIEEESSDGNSFKFLNLERKEDGLGRDGLAPNAQIEKADKESLKFCLSSLQLGPRVTKLRCRFVETGED